MDDMMAQVAMMAGQPGSDPAEVLSLLCTVMAIDEGEMSEQSFSKMTKSAIDAAAAQQNSRGNASGGSSGPSTGDCYGLAARCIAIFLERQAKVQLAVNISTGMGDQISALVRQIPLAAPTASNSGQPPQALLRYSQLSPNDFIEDMLRILAVHHVYRAAFTKAGVQVPGDAMLVAQTLEWIPHAARRVLPGLATFCAARIVSNSLRGERIGERPVETFLRLLQAELESDDMFRAEELLRIATCIIVRTTPGEDRTAGQFAQRLFKMLGDRVQSHGNTQLLTLALRTASAAVFAPGGGVASLLQAAGPALRDLMVMALAIESGAAVLGGAAASFTAAASAASADGAAAAAAASSEGPASPLASPTTSRRGNVRLVLPTLFAQSNKTRVGPVAKKDEEVVSDSTWVLSVISLIVCGGGGAPPSPTTPARVEPRLKWSWQAGDTVTDYAADAMHSLTHAFLLKASSARVQTPHGQFNCLFDVLGQASNDNKRIRPIACSFLPEKVDLIDPSTGAGMNAFHAMSGGAAPAAASSSSSSSASAVPPPVLEFLRSVADSHFLHELMKLRASEFKGVVDATMLRLLEIGVFSHAVMREPATAASASAGGAVATAADSGSGKQGAAEGGQQQEVSALHEEVAHVLVELLQNSSVPNACLAALKSVLQAASSKERQRWVAFLAECGFTDVLAALVAAAPPPSKSADDDAAAVATDKSSGGGRGGGRRGGGGRGGGGAGRGGGGGSGSGSGFFGGDDAASGGAPIDHAVATVLLGMLGDENQLLDADANRRSIQDVLRLAVAKLHQLDDDEDKKGAGGGGGGPLSREQANRTPPQPNRELRALLMEFAQKVRQGRSNPRKLIREITDPKVMAPSTLAAFIAPDAALARTIARAASSSWFGPIGKDAGSTSNNHTAFNLVTQAGGNAASLTIASPNRLCPAGHGLTAAAANRSGSTAGCTLCGVGAISTQAAAAAAAAASKNNNNNNNNNNKPGGKRPGSAGGFAGNAAAAAASGATTTLWSCNACDVRYCDTCLPSSNTGAALCTCNVALLATVCDVYRFQASRAVAAAAAPAASSGGSDANADRRGAQRLCYAFSATSTTVSRALPVPASTPVLALTPALATNHATGKQYRQRMSNALNQKKCDVHIGSTVFPSLAAPAPQSLSYAPHAAVDQHLAPLHYLAQVIPDKLAACFAEELGAWLHNSAADITLGGAAGMHRKIVDCLPALRLVLPVAARFDFWRYVAIGARRRALSFAAEREYGPVGDVPLHLSIRKMDQYAFSVPDRATSDVLAEFARRTQDVISAPLHTRMDCFFGSEVGRGEGPTQEVYSELARQAMGVSGPSEEVKRAHRALWCREGATGGGLIPAPRSESAMYAIGVACGRALLDGFVVNVPLHEVCYRVLSSNPAPQRPRSAPPATPALRALRDQLLHIADPDFVRGVESLRALSAAEISAAGLEDEETGAPLTKALVPSYIDATLQTRYCEIQDAILAFGVGLQRMVDFNLMRAIFDERDLAVVVGGNRGGGDGGGDAPLFTAEELDQCVVPAHGYNQQSPQILWFKQALLSFTPEQQADFVEFLTGARALPCGGLTGLSTAVTVVKKDFDDTDNRQKQGTLPSVSTCFLYCKVPPYSDFDTLRERLLCAIVNGRRNFSHS